MKTTLCVCALSLFACGGGNASAPPATASNATSNEAAQAGGTEPQTFDAQVAVGQDLYGAKCASCHGASGQGGPAPAVVGLDKGALPLDPQPEAKYRKSQFKNAGDVADFVVKNMPPNAPGSLKEWQYWAILAFDLHANGVDLPNKLDSTNAKDVTLHK